MKKRAFFGLLAMALAFGLIGCGGGGDPTHMIAIEMVRINGGTFTMGSPATEPGRSSDGIDETQHSVTLSAFYMGKYQVTQKQWQTVMVTNPSFFWTSSGGDNPANRPVELVNWYDALVFCNKLSVKEGLTPAYSIDGKTDTAEWGTVPFSSNETWNNVTIVAGSTGYRLPTEAQWEYACRAGTTTAWYTGDAEDDALKAAAWYSGNAESKTHEVGKKTPNAWGLYDMHGNVWEWCWDWYGDYSSGAQTDPAGAASGDYRVVRGGSWAWSGNRPEYERLEKRTVFFRILPAVGGQKFLVFFSGGNYGAFNAVR